MKQLLSEVVLVGCGILVIGTLPVNAQANLPACDPDNGGITLPDGFCAMVVADDLGAARHLTVAPNGDLYVAIRNQGAPGDIIALRDTTGDGRADHQERFGRDGGTSIGLHNNYLYFGRDTAIERYRMRANELVPEQPPEVLVTLPDQEGHRAKGLPLTAPGACLLTSAPPPMPANPADAYLKRLVKTLAAYLSAMVACGDSTRIRRTKLRKRELTTQLACDRTSRWHGIRPKAGCI